MLQGKVNTRNTLGSVVKVDKLRGVFSEDLDFWEDRSK